MDWRIILIDTWIDRAKKFYQSAFINNDEEFNYHIFGKYADEMAYKRIKDRGVLIFDGTDDKREWASNFKFRSKNGYHRGFYSMFKDCERHILRNVQHLFSEQNFNFVIGFSRGGPSSSFAAKLLCEKYPIINITFGGARFCKRRVLNQFEHYNLNIINVENSGDIVPRLLRFTYKKPGLKYKIKKGHIAQFWNWFGKNHDYFD